MEINVREETNFLFQRSHVYGDQNSIKLPVLEKLLSTVNRLDTKKILEKTLIYYVHHPLQTSINIIDSLVELGASYNNIFVLGKCYSQCDAVVYSFLKRGVNYQHSSTQLRIGQYAISFIRDINWLWFKLLQHLHDGIENILILDHGGHAVTYAPPEITEHYRVIGIEKTSSGLFDLDNRGLPPFPLIDVANCAAKLYLESPLIAKTVVNKLFSLLPEPNNNLCYGVVGIGSIGNAIIERLVEMGQNLIVFDINKERMKQLENDPRLVCAKDTRDLITECDWIFGCSGRDFCKSSLAQLRIAPRDKTFISCSSEDKEFLSLLRMIEKHRPLFFNPLETIEYQTELGANIRILRGGFPINFDHSGESVPANEIQLTRSLVIGAVLQAIDFFNINSLSPSIYPLSFSTQKFIVSEWIKCQNLSNNDFLVNNYKSFMELESPSTLY